MNKEKTFLIVFLVFVGLLGLYYFSRTTLLEDSKDTGNQKMVSDDLGTDKKTNSNNIDPTNFSTKIDNKYFSLPVGRVLTYEGMTEDGLERVEIRITGETKKIMGVETLVYSDKVWQDGELVEDTRDYLAQDDEGNVWYFGEDVDNYEDGELEDHEGSWVAGVDGALPGIWIKAVHTKGDSYKQEYYKGFAEDMRDVVSIGESVTIGLGSYKDCVKMYDWTTLEPDAREHKTYCSEVGAMVLEENLESDEKLELVSVE